MRKHANGKTRRLLVIGLAFVAGCGLATRRERLGSGDGGQGNSTGVSGPIHGELPEEILPPGAAGAGGSPPKMACTDSPTYTLSYSPGYSDAEHQRYLAMAQSLRGQMTNLTQKAEQLRGVFSGEGSPNWEDIQRSFDNDDLQIRGWQYRDGPRGLNIDQPVSVGDDRNSPGTKVAEHGSATAFPVPVARGAAFDVGLEFRIGQAMGDELVAANMSMFLVPCVNILRHPFWGRAQETYGEDSFLLGRIGTGQTAGIQQYSAACAKHWAANNIERDRWIVNSQLEPRTLREIYGRHFEMIVQDGGVACVMAAYNSINGTKATQNKELLTTILRGEFGFKGLVLSDWWAMPGYSTSTLDTTTRTNNARDALMAGLDIEVPWSLNYKVIDEGLVPASVPESLINEHVDRVLAQKLRFKAHVMGQRVGLKAPTSTYVVGSNGVSRITNNDDHIAIAEEAARKSMVLLKNCPMTDKGCAVPATDDSNVLPIKPVAGTGAVTKIAVVGPTISYCNDATGPGIQYCNQDHTNKGTINFATGIRTGDTGSSRVNVDLERSVSPFAGVCEAVGGTVDRAISPTACAGGSQFTVTTATTAGGDVTPAVAAAQAADVVVVVVGLTPYNEGEQYNGNDRDNLSLDGKDHGRGYGMLNTRLVDDIAKLGKPMVVVIEAGAVVDMPWLANVPAVVMAWYPGMVGGRALGKLLLGTENFSGKLPVTWPMDASQYPTFDDMPSGTTRMDYFLGYRRFDMMKLTPRYSFGYGLSYARFHYANLQVPCSSVTKNGVVEVKVDVANTSPRGGDEVVMLFVRFPTGPAGTPSRSVKELKGFYRVGLDGLGQTSDCRHGDATTPCASTKRITIPVRVRDLKYYDTAVTPNRWDVQPGEYRIVVAPSSGIANKALQATPELCPAGGGIGCPLSDTFNVN